MEKTARLAHAVLEFRSRWLLSPIVIAMLAIAMPAVADQEADEQWEKLRVLTSGDTDEARLEHLKSHGLSEEAARALRKYVDENERKLETVMREQHLGLCSKREVLNDPESLAQEIEREEELFSDRRRIIVDGANKVLSDGDSERLDHLIKDDTGHGPKVEFTDLKIPTKIREGQIPVAHVFNLICGAQETP